MRAKRITVLRRISLVLWAGIIVWCIIRRDSITLQTVLDHTPGGALTAIAVLYLFYAFKSVSIVLPVIPLYLAAGILFPLPAAVAVNVGGSAIMVSIPYFIGKRMGEAGMQALLARYPRLSVLNRLHASSDFLFSLAARSTGILPHDPVSMLLGAMGIRYCAYLTGSLLGILPACITFPILGENIRTPGSAEFIIALGVQIVCSVVCIGAFLIRLKKHKADAKTNPEENNGTNADNL